VKVWEKLHTYKERKGVPFGAWLFRVARYEVIDAYRAHRDVQEFPEEVRDPDEMNRADTQAKRGDLLRIVRKAMDQLPRRYRDILLLSYMADLPHSEIARTLKMSEGAVRVLKFRALKKLEALLPPEMSHVV
jgi:RNA polymerase sigma-70 factor (ECF subfamily)